jgi:protein disulfide-isomerase A1
MMRVFSTIAVLATISAFFGQVLSKGTPYDHVVDLTADNFEEIVQQDPANGLWFLKLYAPWCTHCKTLAPILDKVAPHLKGKMAFGKIDCTSHKKFCKDRFDLKGYPTLKIYRDGAFFDYPGERHADAIITFGEKMSENPIQISKTVDHAIDEVGKHSKDKVVFVAYDPSAPKGQPLEDTLRETEHLQMYSQVARIQQAFASFGYIPSDASSKVLSEFGAGKEVRAEWTE